MLVDGRSKSEQVLKQHYVINEGLERTPVEGRFSDGLSQDGFVVLGRAANCLRNHSHKCV